MTFEDRVFDKCLWFVAACVLMALLSSCSAAIDLPATATTEAAATAAPMATRTAQIVTISPSSTPAPQCTVTTGIDDGALNLRVGPGTQHAVIRVLREGEVLTVTARGAWLEVRDSQGKRGYVNSRYCK
jgi:uncharacterized protein YgiM (DUF1202 family)